MTFSYNAVWEDTVAMLRGNAAVATALAGVFFFLPGLLLAYFLPAPTARDGSAYFSELGTYLASTWHWRLLAGLAQMTGTITLYAILFGRGGGTVGSAIAAAFRLLPFFFLAWLIGQAIIGLGLIAFIVPAVYLFGRLAPLGPLAVAEERRNPIQAVRDCFALTRGRGWAAVGLVLLVFVPAIVLSSVVTVMTGILFSLALGHDLAKLLMLVVGALLSAAVLLVLTFLYAAIYRRLRGAAGTKSVT
jgi:hypothetical protein